MDEQLFQLRCSAFHEAGHIVVGLSERPDGFRWCRIDGNGQGKTVHEIAPEGETAKASDLWGPREWTARSRASVRVALGGIAGELAFNTNIQLSSVESDFAHARELILASQRLRGVSRKERRKDEEEMRHSCMRDVIVIMRRENRLLCELAFELEQNLGLSRQRVHDLYSVLWVGPASEPS